MRTIACQLLVIGAGPGGYVAAIRAGQRGLDTVVVEAAQPGGTCLNIGCIPSKAVIHLAEEFHRATELTHDNPLGISAGAPGIDLTKGMAWKDGIVSRLTGGVAGLMRKAKVRVVTGRARFVDGKTVAVDTPEGPVTVKAKTVIIATGSVPVELPFLPFGGRVLSSTGALALTEVPKSLAVVGGGYIGLELGTAFAKLGAKVTVIEAGERILPAYDADLTAPVAARLAALGVTVLTGTQALGLSDSGLTVRGPDGAAEVAAQKVLVTVGRRPNTAGIEPLGLTMDGPFLRVDDRMRTSMTGILAIGDVTGEPMLAHRAMAQAEIAVDTAAGGRAAWDKRAMPAICFTDPELVTVGQSPSEAGDAARSDSFPFKANGRAMTLGREDGFIRVVSRKDNGLVLGVQAVGAGISELAAAFALAIEMGATVQDIAGTIHAHPTQGEAFPEAALKAFGHALHI
ncbi:dihydrolipoamide dehydrogenase [Gemmobacter megaterium]|uniref:Dihydrolipoyl dehydrogenase n=1 Tax=Gemmobacter megaterium TaxID=1086013 RepID=A0A1N7NWZ1_9RHOB|nr:dihydrolipoyl dehydrogenase [Gemmobacter megaterium]GGE16178.1 dihydrolipoyl dehydrogenase [Gemmobacter megaterium]SIT02729.1 dihydrolipoamide dehydrogenase [Gemmobacter megaterium]